MVTITYQMIREAMAGKPYPMTIAEDDEMAAVVDAVNEGIDSHLEACNCPDRGDSYEPEDTHVGDPPMLLCRKLACVVSVESFPVLLRRLWVRATNGNEAAENLLSSILGTLGDPGDSAEEDIEIISPVDEQTARPTTL